MEAADVPYLRSAMQAGQAAADFLRSMEAAMEQLAPERGVGLAETIRLQHGEALHAARVALDSAPAPAELQPFADHLADAFAHAEDTFGLFTSLPTAPLPERIPRILGAMHQLARAQEGFYHLREALPPFHEFWTVPGTPLEEAVAPASTDAPRTGVTHVTAGGQHGGFSLYVPETYTPDRAWPLIIALHGGSGNGRDFLWTWVREAKSLGYLVVAPTAIVNTWGSAEDTGLLEIIAWIGQRYQLARDQVLLTGLSDGATFALLYGLAHPDVYRALAPLCGVLHPANQALGNLDRARGVPIYLVHGALDFLFPVAIARFAHATLANAGADITYRELPELSHTYPRSENVRILRWFESLPPRSA